MAKRALKEKLITIPEVKKLLENIKEEELDQLQRRTLDYASKFSKTNAESAETLRKNLVEKFELTEEEAVQIINSMPETIEELRIFLGGGRKIIETQKLEAMLKLLAEYRKKE
jgi:DNA-directed RNA polymerase subunit F